MTRWLALPSFATGLALLAWGLVALDKPAVTVGVGFVLTVIGVGAMLPDKDKSS